MTFSIPDKAIVNAQHYVESLLPRFIEECKSFLPSEFIFIRMMHLLRWQSWLKTGLPQWAY